MPNYTPVYRLPFAVGGESITDTMERTRYMAIDRQLEALYTFFGDGVISGWEIVKLSGEEKANLMPGSGVIQNYAVMTSTIYSLNLIYSSSVEKNYNYVYVKAVEHTPSTAAGEIIVSSTLYDSSEYLLLGYVLMDSAGKISSIDYSTTSGRTELTLIKTVLETLAKHIHNGESGEPSKIDLLKHVQGVLSQSNIGDIDASKITSGIFDTGRFKLSHNDLSDIGTFTHAEIDGLIEKFQSVNALLFGDAMTSNFLQLVLSLKHVWENVDDYFYNFFAVIPGIGKDTFGNSETRIDVNSTTAEIDYTNHIISGKYVQSKEIGQYVINSIHDFSYNESNSLLYDPNYISISSNALGNYIYGYGFGVGTGSDYFDVLEATYPDSQGDVFFGVTGDLYGYGVGDFESEYAYSYGYGYGYEFLPRFTDTLYSTRVTLISNTSSLVVHDKISGEIPGSRNLYTGLGYSGNEIFISSDYAQPSRFAFLIKFSDLMESNRASISKTSLNKGDFYFLSTYVDLVRGDQHFLTSDQAVMGCLWNDSIDLTSNNYLNFELKQVFYDKDGNDYAYSSTNRIVETSDEYWSPDVGMDLIIEATIDVDVELNGNTTTRKIKHFFKYVDGVNFNWNDTNEPDYRFFDIKDNAIFASSNLINESGEELKVVKQAQISKDKLWEIKLSGLNGGYWSDSGIPVDINDSTTLSSTSSVPSSAAINLSSDIDFAKVLENITGVYLYTRNDLLLDEQSGKYCFMYQDNSPGNWFWPQGQKYSAGKQVTSTSKSYMGFDYLSLTPDGSGNYITLYNIPSMNSSYGDDGAGKLTYDGYPFDRPSGVLSTDYRESKMLVDLTKVSIGDSSGFVFNESKNIIDDIVLYFPDPVDFNSISWVASEPSDSIVYLQIRRLSTPYGDKTTDYNSEYIFTNSGADLIRANMEGNDYDIYRPGREIWLNSNAIMYPSGSMFPSEYKGIRKIAIKAVLLPSHDLKVAPVLNSITVNYTSNTSYGSLVLNEDNDWGNSLSNSNIVPGYNDDGSKYLTLEMSNNMASCGRIKNLIYGTSGAVIEHCVKDNIWSNKVKTYTGSDLPKTYFQNLYSLGATGVEGYVTCIKKLKNGDIVFLDQYQKNINGSRIIWVDKNYNLKKLIISEPALKRYSSTDPINYQKGQLVKSVYNPSLGDYGALYLVFSHELLAYQYMYSLTNIDSYIPQTLTTDHARFVNLSKMSISYKGTQVYLSSAIKVIPCGRGTLCIVLSEELQNTIEALTHPKISCTFYSTADKNGDAYIQSSVSDTGSCVTFYATDSKSGGVKGVLGTVINSVLIEKPDYSVVYAPIEGMVSFDMNDDYLFYILKQARPYSIVSDGDDYLAEPWYVTFNSNQYWSGWGESTENRHATLVSCFYGYKRADNWIPNFYLKNYGYRGSIQKKDKHLLITISGDKDSVVNTTGTNQWGVLLIKQKNDGTYYAPEEKMIDILDDTLYPMAVRFDEATYDSTNKIYGDIYVALSDLKISSSSTSGKSKVIKINDSLDDSSMVVMEWGSEELYKTAGVPIDNFAITVNDVFPLSYNHIDGYTVLSGESETEIIVST